MKVISKSIEIAAPKEKIWEVLLQDHYGRIWMGIFSPGSHAITTWAVGEKVVFTDGKDGIFGRIVIKEPNKIISMEYDGILQNGIEDNQSEQAKPWIGTHETYILSDKGDKTLLNIEVDIIDDFYEMMDKQWDKALLKIEELATGSYM